MVVYEAPASESRDEDDKEVECISTEEESELLLVREEEKKEGNGSHQQLA
jgi:hypothetical protein